MFATGLAVERLSRRFNNPEQSPVLAKDAGRSILRNVD